MPSSRFVFDASRENFPQLVLGNSDKGPALAYFWMPTADSCMMLMPR
jgi:putative thioredoxin